MGSISSSQEAGQAQLAFHFGNLIKRLDPDASETVSRIASELVLASGMGHVCLSLDASGRNKVGTTGEDDYGFFSLLPVTNVGINVKQLEKDLLSSKVVGRPGDQKPLILDHDNRLYLYRYWQYEKNLAEKLLARTADANDNSEICKINKLLKTLSKLFPDKDSNGVDWQKVAVVTAYAKKFCVISGGPGTGKTTTVVKLLALLLDMAWDGPINIGLAAPTGKAAARLQESIKEAKIKLDLSSELLERIPEEVLTVHRLLGYRHNSPYFKHDVHNPLNLDVLIVDEASMIDLALMAKLVSALPPQARLVLLGDKDQLASVEAGKVLGDICRKERNYFSPQFAELLKKYRVLGENTFVVRENASPLADGIVILEKSYRFGNDSGIGTLAKAINNGDTELAEKCFSTCEFRDLYRFTSDLEAGLESLAGIVGERYGKYLQCDKPGQAFLEFNRFRLLCVHRHGRFGVGKLNEWVEATLIRKGLICKEGRWYKGRPIMITANDYSLQLFNGDTGIAMPDRDGRLRVFFVGQNGAIRSFSPLRLPEHQTAFAMTVHKSQGSEFEHVVLLMPDQPSPVLSRELFYTAVTRAKKSFSLWGDDFILQKAMQKRIRRSSGLGSLLRLES